MEIEMTGGPHVLTSEERKTLKRLEREFTGREQRHLLVGRPLRMIRDRGLYRETHRRFEDYCRERWGMPRQTVNRYIRAVEIVEELTAKGLPAPRSEKQARPLGRLSAEERARVARNLTAAGGFGGMSASDVARLAEAVCPSPRNPKVAAQLTVVTTGGRVGPSAQAHGTIVRGLREMAAQADCLQALGPRAVPDAVRAMNTEEADSARADVLRVLRLVKRFSDAFGERGGEAHVGQHELPMAA